MSETFKCRGFDENVVLTVKNSFIDSDLRKILIEEDDDHLIKYHDRSCGRLLSTGAVSEECSAWFNSLSDDLLGQYHSGETISEVSRDVNGNPSQSKSSVEADLDVDKEIESEENYNCDSCGENFTTLRSFRIHRGKHHKGAVDSDLGSGKSLQNSQKHKKRLRSSHKEKRGRPSKTEPELEAEDDGTCSCFCKICGKIYDTETNLKKHVRRCHETAQKPCHICGMMVKELSIHIKHQHLQKDVKKYFCEFCGQGFKGYSGYQFHVAGHTGERKYTCGNCGKCFRTSSEAKKCERGHAGLYKWNCSLCSYKCHQKNKLVRHMRTHTKSQPYSCPLCGHRAARKDYLQKHVLKAHTSLSLEQVESLHPDMYHIQEKVSLQEGKDSRSTEEIKERLRESRLSVMKSFELSDSFDCDPVGDLDQPQAEEVPQDSFSISGTSDLMSTAVIVATSPEDAYFKI